MRRATLSLLLAALAALPQGGCSGPQSALETAGRSADQIARLWWIMAAGTVAIFLVMVGLYLFALQARGRYDLRFVHRFFIWGGGALFPTTVVTALLVHGLASMPEILAPAPAGSLQVHVSGEQWWWRIHYTIADGRTIETANEIRLPVGHPVEFTVSSPDVIHSFWIPSLGGKVDMIPGRVNRLRLDPHRTGTFRGMCAEYCGGAHAWMAFDVVVMEPAEFDGWLEAQSAPAREPVTPELQRGRAVFDAHGCGACHTVATTRVESATRVGPDLTHVGSRLSLGAGTLPNTPEGFRRWLVETDKVKPEVLMPHFAMIPSDELAALVAYLESLQ